MIDEFSGLRVVLVFVTGNAWVASVLGFTLFRAFDIAKPWPVSWTDKKLHGGFCVMLDDIIAGEYAALCLSGLYTYGPPVGWLS